MNSHSTKQAAKLVGIHWDTLQRWVAAGKVRPSQVMKTNGLEYWLWTDRDVERVRKFKEKNYWKGRGRRPKPRK